MFKIRIEFIFEPVNLSSVSSKDGIEFKKQKGLPLHEDSITIDLEMGNGLWLCIPFSNFHELTPLHLEMHIVPLDYDFDVDENQVYFLHHKDSSIFKSI